MKANPQLKTFLSPYSQEVQKLVIDLRTFVTEAIPEANELIWDNYNALAIAYSKSEKLKDAFCHIAVYSKHANFGFNRGTELKKSTLELSGKGKLIRYVTVKDIKSFPIEELKKLLWEAMSISEKNNPDLIDKKDEGKSIVMSISNKKRRPN